MTNLNAMNERMAQWQAEKPGFDTVELKLYEGDVAIVCFVSSGNDGDWAIKPYKSHVFPQFGSKGNRYNAYRYCTLQNDGQPCVFCEQGHTDIKERMSMWFYTYNILHGRLPNNKPNLPQATYENRIVYNEEVSGFKRWDDSAWRESPWDDIVRLNNMYNGLHFFTATLSCTGSGMNKRYKIFPIPNSAPLPEGIYQRATQECTPIPHTLRAQQQQPVAINPQAQQNQNLAPAAIPMTAFSLPGTPTPPPLAIPAVATFAGAVAPPPAVVAAAPAPPGASPVYNQPPAPVPVTAPPVAVPTFIAAAPPPSAISPTPDLGLPPPPVAPPPAPAPAFVPPPVPVVAPPVGGVEVSNYPPAPIAAAAPPPPAQPAPEAAPPRRMF